MRSNVIPKLIASAILSCVGVATTAQDVHYNYDRDADFAVYKTYQWVERDRRPGDQLLDNDIRRAIANQLAQRGLQEVANKGDLYIQYQTAIDKERQVDAWSMGPRWSGMARASTSTIDIGTLIVSMYDPAKKTVGVAWKRNQEPGYQERPGQELQKS